MKKTNTAEKYLTQRPVSVPDLVCVGVMLIGFILISFVHHGGRAGVIVLFVGIAGFIFSRAARIGDAAYENEVTRLFREYDVDLSETGILKAYDLTQLPVVRGGDGTWRSGVFFVTRVITGEGLCHVRWYRGDLVARTVTEQQMTVPLSEDVYVTEKEIIIKEKGNVMTHWLHLSDDVSIPITTATMAFEVLKRKLRLS